MIKTNASQQFCFAICLSEMRDRENMLKDFWNQKPLYVHQNTQLKMLYTKSVHTKHSSDKVA